MADRTRGRFVQRRGPQRLTQWIAPVLQVFVTVASGTAVIIASIPAEDPFTFVRTRGMVAIRPDVYSADLDIIGAVGMGIVTAEAFAAGVGSIPEPYTDGDWGGWFVWRSFGMRMEFRSDTGMIYPATQSLEIDSKAMRKIAPNEVMVVVAESFNGGFAIMDGTRHLIKLA